MNAPQIHLMLNHIPVLGVMFAAAVLLIGLASRHAAITRLGVATLLLAALVGIPVFLSGEPAEEAIEHAPGVSEQVIEPHEDAAKISMIGLQVLGLVALVGLLRFRRVEVPRGFASILLVATLALGGALAWTAHLGGQIRHPELRGESVNAGAEKATIPDDDD